MRGFDRWRRKGCRAAQESRAETRRDVDVGNISIVQPAASLARACIAARKK